MENEIRVLLTGGHAGTTALAVFEEIKSRVDTKDWKLYWIGAKRAIEGTKVATLESTELPKLGVKCYSITTGRIQRKFTRHTIPSLLKIPFGFVHAFTLLQELRPKVVLSFGGFAAFPVVVMAWALGFPVVLHEQVANAGRSNLASASFATKIAISRSLSNSYFDKKKTVLTGNPVMKSIISIKPKLALSNPPVLFVTGGSRGSKPLNRSVGKLISYLVKDFIVIHLTGTLDFDEYKKLHDTLTLQEQKRYEVYSTIDPVMMATCYERADIILARSGANTVSEVLAIKRPALFVPLPFAYNDEQTKNAEFARDFGIAEILPERELNADSLDEELRYLNINWKQMVTKVKDKESPDVDAAKKVVDLLKKYIP